MNKLKYIRAKNFLSIGETPIEVDFSNYGNIIVVKGRNLDVSPNSSNGAGKSTLIEIIVYGLYGELIKGLPHKEALNKKTKKNLEVEVHFDNCKVIRKRPNKSSSGTLELWVDGENVTPGGIPETQKAITARLGLTYEAFINIVCFGEHNNHSFLSCNPATKRSIVENLLGLEKYVKFSDVAKKKKSALDKELHGHLRNYEALINSREIASKRVIQLSEKQSQWKASKEREINYLSVLIESKSAQLQSTDDGSALAKYEQAQQDIKKRNDAIVQLEGKRNELLQVSSDFQYQTEKLMNEKNSVGAQLQSIQYEISKIKLDIQTFESKNEHLNHLKDGVECSHCFGVIANENYGKVLMMNKNQIANLKEKLPELQKKLEQVKTQSEKNEQNLNAVRVNKKKADDKTAEYGSVMAKFRDDISKLSAIKEPKPGAATLLLQQQIVDLGKQLDSKKSELDNGDPYSDIILSANQDLIKVESDMLNTKVEVSKLESEIPYYEFWVQGFGDDGIRSFVIDGTLPALNSRLAYWLQFLIDNKMSLTFDNQFEPLLERNPPDGDAFVYNATSGGERRRINLAISQAFAYAMMLSSGSYPSVISLDEVALNVDSHGVYGIYKMICELARDRQVLVTTHDGNLMDLLENADTITVVKENGFSTLLK